MNKEKYNQYYDSVDQEYEKRERKENPNATQGDVFIAAVISGIFILGALILVFFAFIKAILFLL